MKKEIKEVFLLAYQVGAIFTPNWENIAGKKLLMKLSLNGKMVEIYEVIENPPSDELEVN